jgi:hypothetical protein
MFNRRGRVDKNFYAALRSGVRSTKYKTKKQN